MRADVIARFYATYARSETGQQTNRHDEEARGTRAVSNHGPRMRLGTLASFETLILAKRG